MELRLGKGHTLSFIYDTTGSLASTVGFYNPLRYRGYVYDEETKLYYVTSRYYNPEMGRFLNADTTAILTATPMGVTDKNLFAYCNNNPISRKDNSGTFWLSAVVSAVVNVTTTYIAAKVTGQDYTWKDAGVAALSGVTNAIPVVGPFLSGAISGTYTGVVASQNGANLGEAIFCGSISALSTTASISNLANIQKPALDIVTNTVADFVFGTGYNGMSAATYKAITTNAQRRTSRSSTASTTDVKSSIVNYGKRHKSDNAAQLLFVRHIREVYMKVSPTKELKAMIAVLVLIVLLSAFLFYLCGSLPCAILIMAFCGALVVRFGIATCRTITFCADGVYVEILQFTRFYKWENLKTKNYFECTKSLGYKATHCHGAEFSLSQSKRPQWLMPTEYAVFFHPWTYFFVYFGSQVETNTKVKYPSIYEVDEHSFRMTMADWAVLQ